MDSFSAIIGLWPTAEVFGADLGIPGVTARAWKNRNSIPSGRWLDVVAAAEHRQFEGVTLEVLAGIARGRAAAAEAA